MATQEGSRYSSEVSKSEILGIIRMILRCYGAYFCADDQKLSRSDSLEHEYVDLATDKTNYTGFGY